MTQPSKEACTMGMLAHLLAIFTGFIGPLILYLVKQEEDEFIRFHALQALYWELIGLVLAIVTCGIGGLVVLIFNIIAAMKANEGQWYEYPLVGKWARR
ncbi:MAG: DUF4870 domain-containing protein [Deltaproteobacteria bacterium]|nr:DUF4870 domain-containing protein [Deltaproteobacteria bacterium]